jgi:hypothetical protein
MRLATQLRVLLKNHDEYSDWLAGQYAIAEETGFTFSAYDKGEVLAYYLSRLDPKEVLPPLPRGQHYVWINDDNNVLVNPFLANPTGLDYYREMTRDQQCSVSLTGDESAVVLKAYDYGVPCLNQEEKLLLDGVITKLKEIIHP